MIEGAQVKKKTEYLIGDVAQMVGLSRDALRFYEKRVLSMPEKRITDTDITRKRTYIS